MSAINPASFASPANQAPASSHASTGMSTAERKFPRSVAAGSTEQRIADWNARNPPIPYLGYIPPSAMAQSASTPSYGPTDSWGTSPLASSMPGMPYSSTNFYPSPFANQNPSPFANQNSSPFANQNPSAFASQAPAPAAAQGQTDAELSRLMQNMSFRKSFDRSKTACLLT